MNRTKRIIDFLLFWGIIFSVIGILGYAIFYEAGKKNENKEIYYLQCVREVVVI